MKTFLDIRLPEGWAARHLNPSIGEPMFNAPGVAPIVRKVVIDTGDASATHVIEKLRTAPLFSCSTFNTFEPPEVANAEVLLLIPDAVVETYGQGWGTEYDESRVCPKCGFGRRQTSRLAINTDKFPRTDFVRTVADELLLSQRLTNLVREHSITGCDSRQIESRGRGADSQRWHQLVVTETAGRAVAPTRFGIDYFHPDMRGEYVCEEHSHSGLNILSPLYIDRQSKPSTDIARTVDRIGRFAGWLVPSPMLLISRRFAELLRSNLITGYEAIPVFLV